MNLKLLNLLTLASLAKAFYTPITIKMQLNKMKLHKPRLTPHDIDVSSNFETGLLANSAGYLLLQNPPQKSLTSEGLANAAALGIGLWTFLDWQGYFICVSFFIFGSLVTKVGFEEKEAKGIAEKRGGRRGPENVWGSAATAMICAIMTYFFKDDPNATEALKIGYVCSLTTKLSDTFQSEIGKVYGKTTILITTLKRVEPGTEGAVSLEGYAAGIIGSIILAGTANTVGFIDNWQDTGICLLAPLIATTIESYIGAIGQNKLIWLSNEFVNLINTMIGALLGIGGYYLIH